MDYTMNLTEGENHGYIYATIITLVTYKCVWTVDKCVVGCIRCFVSFS